MYEKKLTKQDVHEYNTIATELGCKIGSTMTTSFNNTIKRLVDSDIYYIEYENILIGMCNIDYINNGNVNDVMIEYKFYKNYSWNEPVMYNSDIQFTDVIYSHKYISVHTKEEMRTILNEIIKKLDELKKNYIKYKIAHIYKESKEVE